MSEQDEAIEATRRWIERAVIGLGLCPFARKPFEQDTVRIALSDARDTDALLQALSDELTHLANSAPATCETTLLVHPHVLQDFLDFNDFLDLADACVKAMGLTGEIQVASFHPQYQFADSDADDIANATNRSPYPTLHLLREASVSRAVDTLADPDAIYQRNIAQLRALGWDGLRKALG